MEHSQQPIAAAGTRLVEDVEQCDVMIIGSGVTGLYALYRLRERGFSVRAFEEGVAWGAPGIGTATLGRASTPRVIPTGIRSRRNSCRNGTGTSILPPSRRPSATSTLWRTSSTCAGTSSFNARVVSAVYDECEHRWQIRTEDGHQARAQFLITAVGILSAHYVPDFEGLDSFKGVWCHTGRWPTEGLELAGKRVGVIGTGATGVQLITEIAKEVGHLTVFQRTANYCAPLRNGPIDPETQRQIKASYPDIFKQCSETAGSFVHHFDPRSALAGLPGRTAGTVRAAVGRTGVQEMAGQFL